MPDPKPLRQSLKQIADEVRMIIVLQLADLIIKIVPSNQEGDAWVLGLYAIARSQLRERKANA